MILLVDFKVFTFLFVFLQDKFNISCVSNTGIQELMRCIRSQTESLISGLPGRELAAMQLGLAHRLANILANLSSSKSFQ